MKITELEIAGCFVIEPREFTDERGNFVKVFHQDLFREQQLDFVVREEFFSYSKKGVIRGLHFQTPPHAHNKLVYCPQGEVLDFFVDLRKSSATYGQSLQMRLSQQNNKVLYLPIGIAHGFVSLSEDSLMVYKTDCVYEPSHDTGILWDCVTLEVSIDDPMISARDAALPSFSDFESPFV